MKKQPAVRILSDYRKLELTDKQVSLAWLWLSNPESDNPPKGLRHLLPEEWEFLSNLLVNQMHEKQESSLH